MYLKLREKTLTELADNIAKGKENREKDLVRREFELITKYGARQTRFVTRYVSYMMVM